MIAAAGDIACGANGEVTATTCQQLAVSDLLVGGGLSRVLALGDNQYETGTLTDYRRSYDPSWGRVRDITSPVAGNHEHKTPGAAGYFDYFGAAAGPRGRGYYSFDIGAWHLIALNSNCADLPAGDGCAEGATQNVSAVRDFTSLGVLEMTLYPDGYSWEFVPVAGDSFTDRGSASCH